MNRTILVVDNDPVYARLVQEIARRFNERVVSAPDGESGLEILKNQQVDLVICDVELPVMGGLAFHARIVQDEHLARIPFVFVSATTDISVLRSVRNIPNIRLIPKSNLVELFTEFLQTSTPPHEG
jgi:CheY-like chemotaxis protein